MNKYFDLVVDRVDLGEKEILIFSDVHLPYGKRNFVKFLDKIPSTPSGRGVAVCVGDFIDAGKLSPFPVGSKEEANRASLEKEIEAFKQCIELLKSTGWSKVIYIPGNHEQRVVKRLCGETRFCSLFGGSEIVRKREIIEPGVYFTRDSYINVVTSLLPKGERQLLLLHTQRYSRYPVLMLRILARKQKKHVFASHSHIAGVGICEGRFIVALPSLVREKEVLYIRGANEGFPQWGIGGCFVGDNKIVYYCEDKQINLLELRDFMTTATSIGFVYNWRKVL